MQPLRTCVTGWRIVRQFLEARLVEELRIHLAPVLLGDGVRLFDHIDPRHVELEIARIGDSPGSRTSPTASTGRTNSRRTVVSAFVSLDGVIVARGREEG